MPISFYGDLLGIIDGRVTSNYKGGEIMATKKKSHLKVQKNAQSSADVELAGENGLEKIALRAQKKSK